MTSAIDRTLHGIAIPPRMEGFEPLNLDDLSTDAGDLLAVAAVYHELGLYAQTLAEAMTARATGRFAVAQALEAENDRRYHTLPTWAQW